MTASRRRATSPRRTGCALGGRLRADGCRRDSCDERSRALASPGLDGGAHDRRSVRPGLAPGCRRRCGSTSGSTSMPAVAMTMAGARWPPGRQAWTSWAERAGSGPRPTSRSCRPCREPPQDHLRRPQLRRPRRRDRRPVPDYPVLFPRCTTTLVADGDAAAACRRRRSQLDYEGELVAVIGDGGRNIPRRPGARARGRVLDLQRRLGARLPAPHQPVPAGQELRRHRRLRARDRHAPTSCRPARRACASPRRWPARSLQDSNTKQLIFDVGSPRRGHQRHPRRSSPAISS